MSRAKNNDEDRTLLGVLATGPKLVIQLRGLEPAMRRLIASGRVQCCDHPDVKQSDGTPAKAIRLVPGRNEQNLLRDARLVPSMILPPACMSEPLNEWRCRDCGFDRVVYSNSRRACAWCGKPDATSVRLKKRDVRVAGDPRA